MFLSRSFAFAFASFLQRLLCVFGLLNFLFVPFMWFWFFFLPTNFSFGFPGHDDTHHGRDPPFYQ